MINIERMADFLTILFLILPSLSLALLLPIDAIKIVLWGVSGIMTYIISIQIFEGVSAIFLKSQEFTPSSKEATKTIILPMYLPNEQGIVFDTLDYFKGLNIDKKVYLAYNTPFLLKIESDLNEYELENGDWLSVVKVTNSTSKAENINYILKNYPLGEMVCFFDADARPMITNFSRANYWLFEKNYDYVQGRCKIRSSEGNMFETAVALNFSLMYSVCHRVRDSIFDYALFGGSNGYWKSGAIASLGFDSKMLTEDIDCAVRAMMSGYKGKYDEEIISSEEAPPSLGAFITQRTRWTQGWFEVTLKYFWNFIRIPKISLKSKLHVINLFVIRELFTHVKLLSAPLVISLHIQTRGQTQDYFGGAVLFYSFIPYFIQTIAGYFADKDDYWSRKWKLIGVFASLIFYTFIESFIVMRGHIRHILGINKWVTTPRSK